MPESAAKAINRRKISNTNNGGDDDDSKTTRRCRPGTYNTRWAGFGSTSPNGGTTFMCVAAIACCGMPARANGQMTPCTSSACDRVGPLLFVQLHDTVAALAGIFLLESYHLGQSSAMSSRCRHPFRDWSARRWSFSMLLSIS